MSVHPVDVKSNRSGYEGSDGTKIDETGLSITLLSGKRVWGPAPVDFEIQRVGDFCEVIAKSLDVHPLAVVLFVGERELQPARTFKEEEVSSTCTDVKAMVLSVFEMAKRILADKFNPKRESDQDEVFVPELIQSVEAKCVAWIASLAEESGCGEFPEEIEGWLKAVYMCKKMIGHGIQFNRKLLISKDLMPDRSPGLLSFDVGAEEEDVHQMYFVDVNGELAGCFGADSEHCRGAVWFYRKPCCMIDDWNEVFAPRYGLYFQYSLPFFRAVVEHCKQTLDTYWLPIVVAPCLTQFFISWHAEKGAPTKATADLAPVQELFDDIDKQVAEQLEKRLAIIWQDVEGLTKPQDISASRSLAEILGWTPTPVSEEEASVPAVWSTLAQEAVDSSSHQCGFPTTIMSV